MPDINDYDYLVQSHDEWDRVIFDHGKCRIESYDEESEESEEDYDDQWISDRLVHLLDVWHNLKSIMSYNNVGHVMNFGHFTNYMDEVSKEEQLNWKKEKFYLSNNISDAKLSPDEWSTKYYDELENCAGYIISEGYKVGSFRNFGLFMWNYSI